ncbi:MAG TPA: hypothetical protein VF219_06975, partial [Vicinamibacterales bacterium]
AAGELIEMPVGVDIRLLRDVLSLRIISENRAGDPIQTLVVPTHDDFKQTSLPGTHAPHDLCIRHWKVLGVFSE